MRSCFFHTFYITVFIASFLIPQAAYSGKLNDVEEAIHKEKPEKIEKKEQKEKKYDPTLTLEEQQAKEKADSMVSSLMDSLYFNILLAPFTLPKAFTNDDYSHFNTSLEYPYQGESEGFYSRNPGEYEGENLFKGKAGYGYYWAEENIFIHHGYAQLSYGRLGLDADYRHLAEPMESQEDDKLDIYTFNGLIHFARSENINFAASFGYKTIQGDNIKGGFNVGYKIDWFPVKPLHLGIEGEYAWIGADGVWRVTPFVGVLWENFELSGAYDYYDFSGETIKAFELRTSIYF